MKTYYEERKLSNAQRFAERTGKLMARIVHEHPTDPKNGLTVEMVEIKDFDESLTRDSPVVLESVYALEIIHGDETASIDQDEVRDLLKACVTIKGHFRHTEMDGSVAFFFQSRSGFQVGSSFNENVEMAWHPYINFPDGNRIVLSLNAFSSLLDLVGQASRSLK